MEQKYEITSQISDDTIMNNAIMTNMEEISNLRNTIELQQRLIATLNARVDVLMRLVTYGSVNIESRL
ncbi:hypothetical protein ES705_25037 [subsurface metagenome]